MMSLIDLIKQEADETRAKAEADYREILARNSNPMPGDAKRLREAMAIRNTGPDQLASDLDVLDRERRLGEEAAGWTAELDEQHSAAWAALTQHNEETERIAADREMERRRLAVEADRLDKRKSQAEDAGRKLASLRQSHRELFGLPEPEPAGEPDLSSHGFNVLPGEPETEQQRRDRQPTQFAPYGA
jgi:hypothetical protein